MVVEKQFVLGSFCGKYYHLFIDFNINNTKDLFFLFLANGKNN